MEKKWICMLLCVAMLAGTISVTALAETPGSYQVSELPTNEQPEKTKKKDLEEKVKAVVTGDMAKCGVTTCIMLAAAGVAVSVLKKREEGVE